MNYINTIDNKYFELNGVRHLRKFFSRPFGSKMRIYNAFNPIDRLLDNVNFDQIIVNEIGYNSAAELQAVLLGVIFVSNVVSVDGDFVGDGSNIPVDDPTTNVTGILNAALQNIYNAVQVAATGARDVKLIEAQPPAIINEGTEEETIVFDTYAIEEGDEALYLLITGGYRLDLFLGANTLPVNSEVIMCNSGAEIVFSPVDCQILGGLFFPVGATVSLKQVSANVWTANYGLNRITNLQDAYNSSIQSDDYASAELDAYQIIMRSGNDATRTRWSYQGFYTTNDNFNQFYGIDGTGFNYQRASFRVSLVSQFLPNSLIFQRNFIIPSLEITANNGTRTLATREWVAEQNYSGTGAANAYTDAAVLQLINGAPAGANTLNLLYNKIQAITAIIGGSAPDADNLVNTVAELLAVFANFPEGADIVALLAAKINSTDIINNLTQVVAGKVLDAAQGKILKDAIDALTTIVSANTTAIQSNVSSIAANAAAIQAANVNITANGNAIAANGVTIQNNTDAIASIKANYLKASTKNNIAGATITGLSEQILGYVALPANEFTVGDQFDVYLGVSRIAAGGAASTLRMRLQTVNNNISGIEIAKAFPAAAGLFIPFERTFLVRAGNVINGLSVGVNALSDKGTTVNTASPRSNYAFTPATQYYLVFTHAHGAAPDASFLEFVRVTKV